MDETQNEKVRDTNEFEYYLIEPFGQGGQGKVWLTTNNGIAIKTVTNNDELDRSKKAIKDYQERITKIMTLPLYGLNQFSMPLAVLSDACGYVMRLMSGTSKLSELKPNRIPDNILSSRVTTLPEWLENKLKPIRDINPNQASLVEQSLKRLSLYASQGGLRAKLKISYEIANALSNLHQRGLLFGDISAGNILVSRIEHNIFFIDVDNISLQDSGNIIYTQDSCAPEVYREESRTTQSSDVYAFALLIFELLTMHHPFLDGVAVVSAVKDYENLRDKANRGELPWILDTDDHSNLLANINDPLIRFSLTHALYTLFQKTFSKRLDDFNLRPPIWMFTHALKQAKDLSIVCPHCLMGFNFNEHTIHDNKCPFCDETLPQILTIKLNGKVIWAHELVDISHHANSIYAKQEHLNAIRLTLGMLEPCYAHPTVELKDEDIQENDVLTSSENHLFDDLSNAHQDIYGFLDTSSSKEDSLNDADTSDDWEEAEAFLQRIQAIESYASKISKKEDEPEANENQEPISSDEFLASTKKDFHKTSWRFGPDSKTAEISAKNSYRPKLRERESADTTIADLVFSTDELYVYPAYEYARKLEYSFELSSFNNASDSNGEESSLDIFSRCPNEMIIPLDKLHIGVLLRLSGGEPITLKIEAPKAK